MQFLLKDLQQQHMPALDVEAVDTTDAGDASHGIFALGCAQVMKLGTNLRRAYTTATLTDRPNTGGYTLEV